MPGRRTLSCLLTGTLLCVVTASAGDEIGQPAPRFRAKTMSGE